MLDLTDNNKYIYWSTDTLTNLVLHSSIKSQIYYHRLVGYSDIVIECLDNNPPRCVKNATESKFSIDTEQFVYIKLSSVNLIELFK